MPLYRVRRNVGDLAEAELDAASFRAILCGAEFPGLRWHQSYLDKEGGWIDCIYEARSPEDIREHARISRIPCDEIREVTEIRPETYIGS
jgi:hypothetical protein